ncbi:hypothetical protein [Thioalkalivibrio sp. ALJ15]|uniref:hypothetical protein n=1 Tax=Thioalkalivibrio sp. ALJ15 TaxID=748652 RepID=UPI000372D620|nr:hypothetical protein [Thioalkalivibrio sp. ALJ15]
MSEPNYYEIGYRCHSNRELLREAPVAINNALWMLRRDLVEQDFENGNELEPHVRDAVLVLCKIAAGDLYDLAARVVGEDDFDLSQIDKAKGGAK